MDDDHTINILPHFDSVIFYPDINNPIVPNIKEYFTALFSYETKLFQCASYYYIPREALGQYY